MSVGDLLSGIGRGVATAGRVAGTVLEPFGKALAEEESGQLPQIEAEKRQQQYKLTDEERERKANDLEAQLKMGYQFGTVTPEILKRYQDEMHQLYAGPQNMDGLLKRTLKAFHPGGAVRQASQPLPNLMPDGGIAAATERNKVGSLLQEDDLEAAQARKQAVSTADFLTSQLPPGTSDADKTAFRNNALDHLLKASTGKEPAPKGFKAMGQGGITYGIIDQDTGKQYLPSQLGPGGDAPPQAKSMWAAIQKAAADKQAEADKKEKEKQQHEDEVSERQAKQLAASFDRLGMSEQFTELMGEYRSNLLTYRNLDTEARKSEETVKALEAQYSTPGNKAAVDNELQNFFTTVVQKGGRKTAAELALTLKVGSFGMNLEQMATKASKGELPPDLRKMLLDGMKAVSAEQRAVADQVKPELPALPQRPGAKPVTGAKKVGHILSKAGAKPNGATMKVPGSDGKMHWSDGKRDLGVVQ